MKIDIFEAIRDLRPGSKVRITYPVNESPVIEWREEPVGGKPSRAEIEARQAQLQAAADARAAVIAAGYAVPGQDWALAIGDRDQELLARYGQVLREGKERGTLTDATPAKIKDKDGVTRELTVGAVLDILAGYGLYCLNLYWAG